VCPGKVGFDDGIWELIQRGWSPHPADRPTLPNFFHTIHSSYPHISPASHPAYLPSPPLPPPETSSSSTQDNPRTHDPRPPAYTPTDATTISPPAYADVEQQCEKALSRQYDRCLNSLAISVCPTQIVFGNASTHYFTQAVALSLVTILSFSTLYLRAAPMLEKETVGINQLQQLVLSLPSPANSPFTRSRTSVLGFASLLLSISSGYLAFLSKSQMRRVEVTFDRSARLPFVPFLYRWQLLPILSLNTLFASMMLLVCALVDFVAARL
jgi:hypothetical protein